MFDKYDFIGHIGVILLLAFVFSFGCVILGIDLEDFGKKEEEIVATEEYAVVQPLGIAAKVILANYPVWENKEGGEALWHEDEVVKIRTTADLNISCFYRS